MKSYAAAAIFLYFVEVYCVCILTNNLGALLYYNSLMLDRIREKMPPRKG